MTAFNTLKANIAEKIYFRILGRKTIWCGFWGAQ